MFKDRRILHEGLGEQALTKLDSALSSMSLGEVMFRSDKPRIDGSMTWKLLTTL